MSEERPEQPWRWKVEDGFLLGQGAGTNNYWSSCHHKKKGACGGCYVRLVFAIEEILESGGNGAAEIAQAVLDAMNKERPR